MSNEQAIEAARRRFNNAAHALAASVDVTDRIATDPEFPADRTPRADALRVEMRATDLLRYREADAALTAAIREGDCEHCGTAMPDCRDDRGRFCCEDCTHPSAWNPAEHCPGTCGARHQIACPDCGSHLITDCKHGVNSLYDECAACDAADVEVGRES